MSKLKSRKLWVVAALVLPPLLKEFGVDVNLLHALVSDAQEQVAIVADLGGGTPQSPLVYLAGAVYIWVQGNIDGKQVKNETERKTEPIE